jgi:hypothetical protein
MSGHTDLEERRDRMRLRPWVILAVGAGTAVLLGGTLGGVMLITHLVGPPQSPALPRPFPPPRLQADPAADLQVFQAEQARALEGYGWADRDAGLARIPVARAMEILATRGMAAYAPLEVPP